MESTSTYKGLYKYYSEMWRKEGWTKKRKKKERQRGGKDSQYLYVSTHLHVSFTHIPNYNHKKENLWRFYFYYCFVVFNRVNAQKGKFYNLARFTDW